MVLLDQDTAPVSAPETQPTPHAGTTRFAPRSATVAVVMLALFAAFFLVHSWPQITAPFGDSHDGRNAGTWALASRALREDGLVDSRAGARLAEGAGTYAHHPPLIIAETAVAETLAGERPWATRLPAWLGSTATIALLYVLLRQRGMVPIACAAGIIVACGSQMFFVYGTMLDTLQTSLPFAIAFLIVWLRGEPDARQGSRWPITVLGALLVLSSWEGALLVAVAVGADIARAWRRERKPGFPPSLWGLVVGIGLLAGWLWWADGSFSPIFEQFRARSGDAAAAPGFGELIRSQRAFLGRTFAPALVIAAAPGLIVAVRNPRLRRLALTVAAVTIAYPLIMRDAAYHHDYWNYWLLLTFAIAFTALGEVLLTLAAHRSSQLVPIAALGCVAIAFTFALLGVTRHSLPAQRQEAGRRAGGLARTWGAEVKYLAGNQVLPANWFTYYTGHPDERLDTVESITRAAHRSPRQRVLLKCGNQLPWLTTVCTKLDMRAGNYTAVPIDDLARLVQGTQ